jgi:hypothetical protein
MSAMRFKLWLRVFFGLDDLPSLTMFKAMELSQQTRHSALLEILTRIEKRLINEHVGQPREFAPPILDWETVQAMALHRLESENQPKES